MDSKILFSQVCRLQTCYFRFRFSDGENINDESPKEESEEKETGELDVIE